MFNFPEIAPIEIEPLPIAYSYSDTQVEVIKKYVLEFQQSLDKEHDVALLLTHFGNSILMEVTHIGYEESVLIIFKGLVNGRESTLIQHVSQLNFLLTSVPKDPALPKRHIGFTLPKD
jgi:hypothetical protein